MLWHVTPSHPFVFVSLRNSLLLLGSLAFVGMGFGRVAMPSPAAACNPRRASQVITVTVTNPDSAALEDYPVAVAFDESTVDFSALSEGRRDLLAWDPTSGRVLPHWLESFDPVVGKGLVWVKVPTVSPGASATIWLTFGGNANCSIRSGSGYAVFPFFSDSHDARNWRREDRSLRLTDTETVGPLLISSRQIVESDGLYNGFPTLAARSSDDWVLAYGKGTTHVNVPVWVLRHSHDQGRTWGPEIPTMGIAAMGRTPSGQLAAATTKPDTNGINYGAYSRSEDDGATWSSPTFFDNPASNIHLFSTTFITIDGALYASGYGYLPGDTLYTPSLWSSADDGFTWTKLSEIRRPGEPGMNETAIAHIGAQRLLSMSRTDDMLDTLGRFSDDLGSTWGPLLSYTSQVGALNLPQLAHVGRTWILFGRETLAIPGHGYPNQLVAFVSYDDGKTFRYGTVLDTYTGLFIDGGYSWSLPLPGDRLFVVYYADSHGLERPDIKSLVLQVLRPRRTHIDSLHLVTQFVSAQATRPVNISTGHYSLDFRFHSLPSPSGSQFALSLSSSAGDAATDLVRWELPSAHSADPAAQSGFIADGTFVPAMNSFVYGESYRIRSIVDEAQGLQQGQVLDLFGQVLGQTALQPFAQGTAVHPNAISIGNKSTLRSTNTYLDFVFLRPIADVEPTVTLHRLR